MALPEFIQRPFRKHPPQTEQAFSDWLTSPLGEALLQRERDMLDEVMPRFFGYHAVQVSCGETGSLMGKCVVRHQINMTRQMRTHSGLVARPESIPLAKNSVDLVLLHHTLDFSANPHLVLREASKSIIPGGALVVVGFNPWSLWGVTRLFRLASTRPPWIGRFIAPRRLLDWMGVLGMDVEGYESGWHGFPVSGSVPDSVLERIGERFWRQRGGFYVLVARKSAAMVRPLKTRLHNKARPPNVIPVPLAHWGRNSPDSE